MGRLDMQNCQPTLLVINRS